MEEVCKEIKKTSDSGIKCDGKYKNQIGSTGFVMWHPGKDGKRVEDFVIMT
jgi:hypothetical protein